jgi:uncharacterized protein
MVGADEITGVMKAAETALKSAEQQIVHDRADLDRQLEAAGSSLEQLTRDRAALAAEIPASTLALYETVSKGRKGIAVALAKDERCSECHVRIRPQVFAHIRQNGAIIQCDSCQRILYYVAPTTAASAPTA